MKRYKILSKLRARYFFTNLFPLLLKKITIACSCLLLLNSALGQHTNTIDLGKIKEYDTIIKRLFYYTDDRKNVDIKEIVDANFTLPVQKFPVNDKSPDASCFLKLSVSNTGQQDSFWLYMGKAQQYIMYEQNDSTGELIRLDNLIKSYSPPMFNDIPYASLVVNKGEQKNYFIRADFNFYNWDQFDPVIIRPQEQTAFSFEYFLQPNRPYLYISTALLGIMFSILIYALTIFFRSFKYEYLYLSLLTAIFFVYFLLRLLNIFMFSNFYFFINDFRYQGLQLTGCAMILLFISTFLKLKTYRPRLYQHFRYLIIVMMIFLTINLPVTYSNLYNHWGKSAFTFIRVIMLIYFIALAISLLKKKDKESWYIAIGSFLAIFLSGIALYLDRWKLNHYNFREQLGIPGIFFNLAILLLLLFFIQALFFRTRKEETLQIRDLEKLKLENEKIELEKYRAVMEARDKERNRISQEIHDDIGSGLTSIRLLSEIAKVKSHQANNKELEKISETSNSLMDRMNEIIWTLNSKNDTLPNLIAYLRHLIVEYFEPFQMKLFITIPENVPNIKVDGKVRRSILLCVKEVLHNIVKHSQSTEVNITFETSPCFGLTIMDNGIGFNPSLIESFKNGLINLHNRLEMHGGTCNISNHNGTTIVLKLPSLH